MIVGNDVRTFLGSRERSEYGKEKGNHEFQMRPGRMYWRTKPFHNLHRALHFLVVATQSQLGVRFISMPEEKWCCPAPASNSVATRLRPVATISRRGPPCHYPKRKCPAGCRLTLLNVVSACPSSGARFYGGWRPKET